jgi:mRNA-degrading endonuclease RelE of RelBE toxin-antitoxin system
VFKGKEVKVILTGEAKEEYERLNKIIREEISKDISSSENQTLFNSIKQKINFLKENPEYGTHIPRDRIPKDYTIGMDVNNLWKVDLAGAWRMIYTLRGSEIEILCIVLDIFSHRKYEKKFKYKKF